MKLKHILAGTLFAGLAASASAQTTEITITGATAFRQATMQAIYDAYTSVGALGTSFNVCHDFNGDNLSQLIASNKAVFSGTFPGIDGTTVIRTSFNGSTEGLNAIAGNNDPSFLTVEALGTPGAVIKGSTTTPTETLRPKFSFSDVYQSSSPVDNEVLNPVGSSAVGIVAFTMIANEGAPENLTNVTNQQARALWANGIQPLSLFTGNPDDTDLVFATGRNDGSGTRAAYLTEWTYGVANLVNQYIATKTGVDATAGTISAITLVPADGKGTGNHETSGTSNASSLWGNSNVGNGGYSSSSALRSLMGYTSAVTDVYDGETDAPLLEDANIHLITWLSTADARNSVSAGAKLLNYNGVGVTPIVASGSYLGSGFNEEDFKKIATGAYSPWSYQHLYYSGSLSANESAWYNAMKDTWIPTGLQTTSNGVSLGDVTVSRPDDGFPIVAPL
jgi:hypothetical protein